MTEPVEIAHLLKRTGFGILPDRVNELTSIGWEGALAILVDRAAAPKVRARIPFRNLYLSPDEEDYYDRDFYLLLEYELTRLADPEVGLGDRMLWFWHGVLTSGYSEVDVAALLFRQHRLLAKHALGNYRDMLIEVTTDAAMLTYLSGDGSTGDAPNENYARELMELFTLGRGNYQQGDVRAAARALSGWYLDGYPVEAGPFRAERIRVLFDPGSSYNLPVTYLGVEARFDVPSIIDRILKQDACAKFVAKKLFHHFIHLKPDDDSISSLAAVFRDAKYEIRPLLSALFRHPDFRSPKSRASRARLPMETLLATAAAFSASLDTLDYKSYIRDTGQWPFDPPNVAGWSLDNRWLSGSQALARARLGLTALNLDSNNRVVRAIASATDPIAETLKSTSLYEVSVKTRSELSRAADSIQDAAARARALLSLAVASPEFALA